jgi:hypothetical protein
LAVPDAAATNTVGGLLLQQDGLSARTAAICFVVGSTFYCYLFLRARSIPVPLAWLGLLASVLLLVVLPLELAGVFKVSFLMWIPMLVFELVLALWLLIKGVKPPNQQSQSVHP